MKQWINLLPWRARLFRQQQRRLVFKILGFITALCLTYVGLSYCNQHLQQMIVIKQHQFQQQQTMLSKLEYQLTQLRQEQEWGEGQLLVSSNEVLQLMTWLKDLPFIQGELTEFYVEKERIKLKERVTQQSEFDHIQQYISQSSFIQTHQLNHFITLSDSTIEFGFDIYWK